MQLKTSLLLAVLLGGLAHLSHAEEPAPAQDWECGKTETVVHTSSPFTLIGDGGNDAEKIADAKADYEATMKEDIDCPGCPDGAEGCVPTATFRYTSAIVEPGSGPVEVHFYGSSIERGCTPCPADPEPTEG